MNSADAQNRKRRVRPARVGWLTALLVEELAPRPRRMITSLRWAVIGTILKQEGFRSFSDIRLGSRRIAITSGGDTMARDIDLAIFRDMGELELISKDTDDDPSPLIECVASSKFAYTLSIKNAKSNGPTLIMTALLDVD